mmetsp:Transcript_5471/g.10421  ORF Transcript_5471/g.10421 Transcript_5471/m.10421 type:complete len:106 (-) Transcript_5471:499-816(-)
MADANADQQPAAHCLSLRYRPAITFTIISCTSLAKTSTPPANDDPFSSLVVAAIENISSGLTILTTILPSGSSNTATLQGRNNPTAGVFCKALNANLGLHAPNMV